MRDREMLGSQKRPQLTKGETMESSAHCSDRGPARGKWVLIGFLAIAAFFLWTEHRAHVLGFLPYLFLLACPLMHLFHHGGHHHGAAHQRGRAVKPSEETR